MRSPGSERPQLYPSGFPPHIEATALQKQQRDRVLLHGMKEKQTPGSGGAPSKPGLTPYRHGSFPFRAAGGPASTRERVFVKCRTEQARGSAPVSADSPAGGIRPGLHFPDDWEPHTVSHMTPRPARLPHDPAEEVQGPSG